MPDALSLKSRDRGIIIGTSDSGKSTAANHVLTMFRRDYPNARILVSDTKPRWRGDRLADGTSTGRLYKRMPPGDSIPGSVVISRRADWSLAWDRDNNPTQTVILQQLDAEPRVNVAFQVDCAKRFFSELDYKRPSLIYYDEGHDFFNATGSAFGGDIVQRGFRAGRERGLTSLIGFQRPIGFNPQCLSEANYCMLFHIDYEKDMKRLYEMGWPQNVPPPSYEEWRDHVFKLWRKGQPGAPRYRLNLNSRKGKAA